MAISCPTFESLIADIDGGLEGEAVRSHSGGCDKCRTRRVELLFEKVYAPLSRKFLAKEVSKLGRHLGPLLIRAVETGTN